MTSGVGCDHGVTDALERGEVPLGTDADLVLLLLETRDVRKDAQRALELAVGVQDRGRAADQSPVRIVEALDVNLFRGQISLWRRARAIDQSPASNGRPSG